MLIFGLIVLVVASALVLTLALAASASPVRSDASLEQIEDDAPIKPINMKSKTFATTHQGVAHDKRPVVSAAGMQ